MLISIALILLAGIFAGSICKKCKLPALFGMIIAGIIIGPYGLNMLDKSILNISSELRRIALIIILIRAGLKLNLNDLKKQKRPAIMMCFVPACFEIIGMIILAPVFLRISRLYAAILGAVVAAVGGLPLAAGLGCGEIVLTVSVIAILLTAPLGAFAIDYSYKKWL